MIPARLAEALATVDQQYALVPFMLPTKFPNTFGGDRVAYGFALFAVMLIGMTAAAALVEVVKLYRAYTGNARDPAQMNRIALGGLLLTIIMDTLPTAALYLLWGEQSSQTMLLVNQVRLGLETVSVVPFMASMTALALSRYAITFQLVRMPIPVDLWSSRAQLWQSGCIGITVSLIAFGVAFAK